MGRKGAKNQTLKDEREDIPQAYNSHQAPRRAGKAGVEAGGSRWRMMAEADSMEKLRQVTSWLKEVFVNRPVPYYEVTPQTVDILYNLKEYSETRERHLAFLVEDTEKRAAEYEAQAKYLEDLLTKGLGLSLSSLSSKGTAYLNTLVNSAITLGTKDTCLASFYCAINDMSSELYATELENKELALEFASMSKKLTAALAKENQLEEYLNKTQKYLEVERVKVESRSRNLKFLRDKSEDFKIRIKAAEMGRFSVPASYVVISM
ncbi:Coiled-coil domain-containing protein 5 [Aix galericulata]|nr:Coiled-coil domain-containing protein 5 [Aix galericulata]